MEELPCCTSLPIVDGNKRAAFGALIVFLGLNDIDFLVPPESATAMDAAAGTWSVITLPQPPGPVFDPSSLGVDAAGNFYLAEGYVDPRGVSHSR